MNAKNLFIVLFFITANVLQIGDVADLEALNFQFTTKVY
jgi:hypothetical protein